MTTNSDFNYSITSATDAAVASHLMRSGEGIALLISFVSPIRQLLEAKKIKIIIKGVVKCSCGVWNPLIPIDYRGHTGGGPQSCSQCRKQLHIGFSGRTPDPDRSIFIRAQTNDKSTIELKIDSVTIETR